MPHIHETFDHEVTTAIETLSRPYDRDLRVYYYDMPLADYILGPSDFGDLLPRPSNLDQESST